MLFKISFNISVMVSWQSTYLGYGGDIIPKTKYILWNLHSALYVKFQFLLNTVCFNFKLAVYLLFPFTEVTSLVILCLRFCWEYKLFNWELNGGVYNLYKYIK